MERLASARARPFSEVRLLVCADEEIRLRAPAVCAEAERAAAALVFECARENGDLVSERKGAIWRTLSLHGRPAHAGADTHRGRSAVSALAREILRIEALTAGRPEMTSVITTVRGGDCREHRPGRGPGHDRHPLERARGSRVRARASSSGTGPTTASPARSRTAAPGRRCRRSAWLTRPRPLAGPRSGPRGRRAALGRRLRRLLDRRRRHPHPRRPGARRRRRSHA